jgi:hypothetical protein
MTRCGRQGWWSVGLSNLGVSTDIAQILERAKLPNYGDSAQIALMTGERTATIR